jgi:hypothetical protein
MEKYTSDELLQDFTRGFAFNESLRQQLNYEQMIVLADMFIGWALSKKFDPKQSAWFVGFAEGLLAEADLVGPDWNPPEPEKVTIIGRMARIATGDRIRPVQNPRGE